MFIVHGCLHASRKCIQNSTELSLRSIYTIECPCQKVGDFQKWKTLGYDIDDGKRREYQTRGDRVKMCCWGILLLF